MRRLIMLVNILVMVGCTSLNNKKESSNFLVTSMLPTYNLAGYLPAFKDGYIDGCETAKRSVHGTKNKKRFAKENQYRNGWKDGYNLCLGK